MFGKRLSGGAVGLLSTGNALPGHARSTIARPGNV